MVTTRTTKNKIKSGLIEEKLLRLYTHRAKNLYNAGLYLVRQAFFKNEKYPGYRKIYEDLKGSQDFALMHANTGQQVLRKVDADMKSFFKNMEAAAAEGKSRKVRPPRYKEKQGYASLYLQKGEGFRVKNGMVHVSLPSDLKKEYRLKFLSFPAPAHIADDEISFVEISSSKDGKKFFLSACKELEVPESGKMSEHVMALDLGVNNLIAQVDTASGEGILYSGRQIKSINHHMNKTVSFLKSEAEKKNGRKSSRRIELTFHKRNNQIKDLMHKIAKKVVDDAEKKNIGIIVIGHNTWWKNEVNLGVRNNQNFVQIPHSKLISYIKDKAELKGITVKTINESHTSKCDALAFEPVQHQEKYVGRRTKRGLFCSSVGKVINSDMNGCLNILRKFKCNDESVARIVSMGRVFRPVLVGVKSSNTKPQLYNVSC